MASIEQSIDAVSKKTFEMRGEDMKYSLIISCVTADIELALIFLLIWLELARSP